MGTILYRKCGKCSYLVKIEITLKEDSQLSAEEQANRTPCMQPAPWRTSGICGGSYRVPATEEEYNQKVLEYEQSKKIETLGDSLG